MKLKNLVAPLLLVLGITTGIYAQPDSSEFIRYHTDGKDDGLQIAVTEYVSSSSTVILYGVVHIADADYYKKVQEDLDKCDYVLYEGVKAGNTPNPETKTLNLLQKVMGGVLGLKFQKDSIDYTRKNLIHADISIDELQKSLKGESLTPLGQYVKNDQIEAIFEGAGPFLDKAGQILNEYLKDVPQVKHFQMKLKSQMAQQLSNADLESQMSPEMRKAIVTDRNKIVIDVLNEQLKKNSEKKTYAIFYGAAHMPDLEARLKTMGFEKKSKRWMTAWKVDQIPADEEEDDSMPPQREPQNKQEDK